MTTRIISQSTGSWNEIDFFGLSNLHPTSSIYAENIYQTDGSNDYFVVILTSTSHDLEDLIDAGNIFPDTSRS